MQRHDTGDMVSLTRAKQVTDLVVPWLTLLGFVLGGFWGLYEYSLSQADKRVREALDYVEHFNRDYLREARADMARAWIAADADLLKILEAEPFDNGAYTNLQVRVIQDNNLQLAIAELIHFFDIVYICVRENLCNREVIIAFFRKSVYEFWLQNERYIKYLRTQLQDESIGFGVSGLYVELVGRR